MEKQKQRRKHDWKAIISEWQQSGKSIKDFCQEKELYLSDFYRMKKRLGNTETNLVKIDRQQNALVPVHQPLVLEVNRKYRIEIRNNYSPEILKSVLSVLESA